MADVGTLAITVKRGEFAVLHGPDGTLLAAVTPNNDEHHAICVVIKAPKNVRVTRTMENPWNSTPSTSP